MRCAMSPRRRSSVSRGLPKRGISTTRPGTLLKHQVAIKTFADWTETVPGFVEVDLVAHCGWTGAGPFLYTLTLVDVATGWVSCAGLRDKRAQTVLVALRTLQEGLPFRILGLDSDSGSEFLNAPLVEYCAAQRITFTRGRPYRKNDSCFVEQIPLCQVASGAALGQHACHWCQMRRTRCRFSARRASRGVRPSCFRRAMYA
jgi:hypothetical protein